MLFNYFRPKIISKLKMSEQYIGLSKGLLKKIFSVHKSLSNLKLGKEIAISLFYCLIQLLKILLLMT